MTLSIIIPYYNTKKYTDELLSILDKQMQDDVEVIIVDDGSKEEYKAYYKWLTIIRKENGGVSSARNVGLDTAIGDYIAFIDSDDLVSENYIQIILDKINKEHFDYLYMSWKGFNGWNIEVKLNKLEDEFPPFNLCCWNRVYKRSVIGMTRFNELKKIAEDAEFIREVQTKDLKKSFISDFIYFYRTGRQDSLTQSFAKGEVYTKRTVYNYKHITKDMAWLVDEVKEKDKTGEVIILTFQNDLPELKEHAMIMPPCPIKGTELIGEPTSFFSKIELPIDVDVIIYTDVTFNMGGIETFIYNWCMNMKDKYSIAVLYSSMAQNQIDKLSKYVDVVRLNGNKKYKCKNLIINRITDNPPRNIEYDKCIRMIHGCKLRDEWNVPRIGDVYVPVSNAVYSSFKNEFGCEPKIINNMTYPSKVKPALRLISATRFTFEKGEDRIYKMAEEMNKLNIPFIWTIFTKDKMKKNIPNVICLPPVDNIKDYIASSDYMVALSDSEAFGYSIVEALELGIPVITTPIDVLDELHFKDGETGYIVPFNMEGIDYNKFFNIPKFKYKWDNNKIKKQWCKVLDSKIEHKPRNQKENVLIKVTNQFHSVYYGRDIYPDEEVWTTEERAKKILNSGYCEIIKKEG